MNQKPEDANGIIPFPDTRESRIRRAQQALLRGNRLKYTKGPRFALIIGRAPVNDPQGHDDGPRAA